jgi:hypothetical protein
MLVDLLQAALDRVASVAAPDRKARRLRRGRGTQATISQRFRKLPAENDAYMPLARTYTGKCSGYCRFFTPASARNALATEVMRAIEMPSAKALLISDRPQSLSVTKQTIRHRATLKPCSAL